MLYSLCTHVQEIYENPQFFFNGLTAANMQHRRDGDCWAMAALSTYHGKQEGPS